MVSCRVCGIPLAEMLLSPPEGGSNRLGRVPSPYGLG